MHNSVAVVFSLLAAILIRSAHLVPLRHVNITFGTHRPIVVIAAVTAAAVPMVPATLHVSALSHDFGVRGLRGVTT
jgi:hypothetical protein